MNEGKVLLSALASNKMYTLYLNKENRLNAIAISENGNSYFVTEEKELSLLNEIVSNINKRYIRRTDVSFGEQKLARFENKYNHFSYFAEIKDDGTFQECNYEDYKELYKEYNGIQIRCVGRNNNYRNRGSRTPYSSYGSSYSYGDYNMVYDNSRGRRRNQDNGIAKKVVLGIAGVAVAAGITFAGWNFLQREKLPEVEQTQGITTELEAPAQYDITAEYDAVADTESEEIVKNRYKHIEEQLREAGLQNWEIAQQLDFLAVVGDNEVPISFYYDSDKDEIIYVYEEIKQMQEEKASQEKLPVSSKIQVIYNALNDNPNLTEEFKNHIINTYGPIWQKNEDFINAYELAARYKKLTLDFEYHEDGKLKEVNYSTNDSAAGIYSHGGKMISTPEEYEADKYRISGIEIYDSHSLEETLDDHLKSATMNHEINHINGEFSYYSGTLLNEGYTQLSSVSNDFSRYKNEQLMCILFAETFGVDTLKEGYYGFDLEQAITNKIIEKTGRNSDVVRTEINEFLSDTQDLLYDLDKYGYSENTTAHFDQYSSKLADYYMQINNQDINKNQLVLATMDCLIGSHRANIYFSEDEKVVGIYRYDVDTGKVVYNVGKEYEDIKYSEGAIVNFTSKRRVELDDSNKYHEQILKVEDKDIDYLSR